jgi:hypothetical protein
MTSLERVSMILQHKEADRVPVYPLLNGLLHRPHRPSDCYGNQSTVYYGQDHRPSYGAS